MNPNCRTVIELVKAGQLGGLLLALALTLNGCASIDVKPLKPDGSANHHAVDGIRYYLPKPYLLVAELPPSMNAKSASTSQLEERALAAGAPPAGGVTTNNVSSSSSPGTASDLSFGAATPEYIIKLIYLPDYQHPMAIQQHSGLTGSSTLSPTLQDGWMLTSLNGSADTKVAETLTGLASVISSAGSLAGPLLAARSVSGTPEAKGFPADLSHYYLSGTAILRPGLYSFVYNKKGVLTGLEPVTLFKN
jgi:hypothetical protein